MQNAINMGPTTNPYYAFGKARKARQQSRNQEQRKEKLRKLREMMAGCGSPTPPHTATLATAVHQLRHNREVTQKMYNGIGAGALPGVTPHHTSFSGGYTDGVRDVTRVLIHSPVMDPKTRANFTDYMAQNTYEPVHHNTTPQPSQYSFCYPAHYNTNPTPYTYWKAW